jgi:predicted phosphodiesterase
MSCRFLVIADTHFVCPPTDYHSLWWNRSTEGYSAIMGEALIKLAHTLAPDFAVHCGDCIGWNTRENYEYGAAFMNRLDCPWFAVPGNHDTQTPHDLADTGGPFCLGERRSRMADIGGLRLFLLDTAAWFSASGEVFPCIERSWYDRGKILNVGIPPEDMEWFARETAACPAPAITVTHAPVLYRPAYPMATLPGGKPVSGPLTQPSAFIADFPGREELSGIIRRNSAIKVCFSGHWHIHDAFVSDGILYIMTGSLREYPYEVRLVEFDGISFHISTHPLDVPELRLISYVEEWGNRWVEGTPEVRDLTFRIM